MRGLAAILFFLAAVAVNAPTPPPIEGYERIILIPVDSRPAVGQFPAMIAAMSNVEMKQPPQQTLGQFTKPGNPEQILKWLENQDLGNVSAIIASTDMIAYGGLIESRLNRVTKELALKRIGRFLELRKKWPRLKIYGFSAVMRLTPTATKAASSWRQAIAKLEEFRDEFRSTGNRKLLKTINGLKGKIPGAEIARYRAARKRDHEVQRQLIKVAAAGHFDYLLIGQDDARPYGPHVPETRALEKVVKIVGAEGQVNFCQGIDQHASVLVSRALLRNVGWTPKVRVVYSDESKKNRCAQFESRPLSESLREQIISSGSVPARPGEEYDYTLYVNTPGRKPELFRSFLNSLITEIEQGMPVAVADVNLSPDGTSDPALFAGLWRNDNMMKLLSFAGWNTAGNTIGTSIPAANVYLLARRTQVDPLKREIAQREFLLHRFVNDYAYHRFTRPVAYSLVEAHKHISRDETYGSAFNELNDFVKRDLTKHLERYFRDRFLGRRFFAGTRAYVFSGLNDVRVFLPWPRAYEVRLEFKLVAQEASE